MTVLSMKKLMPALLAALILILPFLIHFGSDHFGPTVFAGLLLVIFASRIMLLPAKFRVFKVVTMSIVCLFCGVIVVYESVDFLLYYPVLMSSFFAFLFFVSLFSEKTLVEEFARLAGHDYPDEAVSYMRGLTKAWVGLLAFNALAAYYSACCQSEKFWLVYNGVVAYVVISAFISIELLYRSYYRRKFFRS